jgi:AcrR family transcriptional regulator
MAASQKQTREEQLIERALQLFSEEGYRETSLEQVTARLGITRPLFYYYFDSKEDLLWRLIGHLGDELLAAAKPVAELEADPGDKLAALVSAHVTALLGNREAFKIYLNERHLVQGTRHQRLKLGEDAYLRLIAAIIEDGQAAGQFKTADSHVLAMLVTGLAHSVLQWYGPGGALGATELASLVASLARDALRPA